MNNKNLSEPTTAIKAVEDTKDATKYNLSKFDYDLYHEEDNIALPVIRVKYIGLPNKGDRWKIFTDAKILMIVEGAQLNNKEKNFLRTIDGVNFLISQCKSGVKSFNALKKAIKKKIKIRQA